MVGRSVGRRGVGRRRALSDGGRRTDISFYFFLDPPPKQQFLRVEKVFLGIYKHPFQPSMYFCLLNGQLNLVYHGNGSRTLTYINVDRVKWTSLLYPSSRF